MRHIHTYILGNKLWQNLQQITLCFSDEESFQIGLLLLYPSPSSICWRFCWMYIAAIRFWKILEMNLTFAQDRRFLCSKFSRAHKTLRGCQVFLVVPLQQDSASEKLRWNQGIPCFVMYCNVSKLHPFSADSDSCDPWINRYLHDIGHLMRYFCCKLFHLFLSTRRPLPSLCWVSKYMVSGRHASDAWCSPSADFIIYNLSSVVDTRFYHEWGISGVLKKESFWSLQGIQVALLVLVNWEFTPPPSLCCLVLQETAIFKCSSTTEYGSKLRERSECWLR